MLDISHEVLEELRGPRRDREVKYNLRDPGVICRATRSKRREPKCRGRFHRFSCSVYFLSPRLIFTGSRRMVKRQKINTCIFPSTGGGGVGIFVIVLEFVGVRRRSVMGTSLWFSFPISLMGLAGIAYLIKDWRTLCIVTAAPAIPLLLGYWYVSQRTPDTVMGFFSTATSFFSLLLFF